MRNFDFYSPTYFVFGKDRETETGRYIKRFGGSRVLVVYGGQSAKRSGLLDRIMACLKEENLYAVELGGVKPNPRSGLVYEGIELCRREKIDFILAVGGGSVIDTAKAIAIGVPYDGDFWDFFSGKVPEQALPVGTVLTIAASGSEGSPDSIITNEKTLEKNGAEADCLRPCFSVLDPALTESLPAYQTACGITDIMAHTFERYFTNTPDVEVTDRMLEGVLLAMLHEGRRVMEDPHNYEARANIMWAGMVCHNDIMGVGRQQDWNSHHLEHVLSAKYDCAHGAGLAVIMPAWMRYCAEHGGEKRLAQMAVRVFGCQMDFDDPKRTALEGIEAFRAFLRDAPDLCRDRRRSGRYPGAGGDEPHRRRQDRRLYRPGQAGPFRYLQSCRRELRSQDLNGYDISAARALLSGAPSRGSLLLLLCVRQS